MKKCVVSLWIVLLQLLFALVGAKPLPRPEKDDTELLAPKETLYYPYAFWLRRPIYDQDYDDGDNSYLQPNRRSSTVSYADVGAGWGR